MTVGRKQAGWLVAVIILLLPLFFLNIRSSHDWGDDFAQYILQAKNLAEGKPQHAGAYIFNPDYPLYAPPLYPVGYPLLLAPVYGFCGNDIRAFNYFQTAILFLFGISVFVFLKRHMLPWFALLMTLVMAYNPWMLNFKTEIIAELPFSLFFLWAVMAYLVFREKPTWRRGILTGALIAGAALIKPAGFILAVAVLADGGLIMLLGKGARKAFWKYALLLGMSASLYLFITRVMVPSSAETAGHFRSIYDSTEDLSKRFNINATYYMDRFRELFHHTNPDWDFLASVLQSFALVLLLLGFFGKLFNRFGFVEAVMLIFLLSVLFFPNTTQGFRYLLPVLPLMLLYIVDGFHSISPGRLNRTAVFSVACFLCLFQYKTAVEKLHREQVNVLSGPQEPAAQEAFEAIARLTLPADVIAFSKPRALALYAGRRTLSNHPGQDNASMMQFFENNDVHFYLVANELPNPALSSYLANDNSKAAVWTNGKFTLYKSSAP